MKSSSCGEKGFPFIALADDNFYPVTLTDLKMAVRRVPSDMVFFTQITMEAGEDPEFLDAMHKARIKGALVGIESVSPEGLKDVHTDDSTCRSGAICDHGASTAKRRSASWTAMGFRDQCERPSIRGFRRLCGPSA